MKSISLLFLPVLMLLMVGCSGDTATPLPTYTPYPTNAAYPTYTPYPTYTAVPPTAISYPTYTPYPTDADPIANPLPVAAPAVPPPTATPFGYITPDPRRYIAAVVAEDESTPTSVTPTPSPTPTPTPINGPECLVWQDSGTVPDPTPTSIPPTPTPTIVVLYPTATPINGIPILPTSTPAPVIPRFLYIDLQKGWNLISFPTYDGEGVVGFLSERSPDSLFYGTGVSTVMTTGNGPHHDEFGLPCVPQDHETNTYNKVALTYINHGNAYWVQANSEVRLELPFDTGDSSMETYRAVHKGWNLITTGQAYKSGEEVHTNTLWPINGLWSQIVGYSQEDGTFTTILPDTGGILITGLGYYVYMDNDTVFY